MSTTLSYSIVKAPDTAGLAPIVIRRPGTHKAVAQPRHLVICAECRFAQLYAEEPLARRCSASELAKDVVFAGRPACAWMTPRDEVDLSLAWCTPGLKTAHARFAQPRALGYTTMGDGRQPRKGAPCGRRFTRRGPSSHAAQRPTSAESGSRLLPGGASGMIACPSCAAGLPEGSRFCLKCGAELGAELTATRSLPEERKVVTTLFCDLVGFTAMSEAADPEDIDALLGEYSARARKMIESHGGTVEKFIGDAVVGVFGVPVVHEDDAERAVRAALRIVEALEGMTWPDGSRLEVRAGVGTGEALVRLEVSPGSGERFLTGDAVNTAARLQSAAPPGAVAVGELSHTLTEDAFVFTELEPLALEGKSEPVRAWLAERPRGRTGLRTARRSATRFVGRQAESAALLAYLREAAATEDSRFCLLVGEPGIGKSRLVLEFARSLDAQPDFVTWRQGRCLPYGEGVTFWALAEIVKAQGGILDSDDVATVEEKLASAVPAGEDAAWVRRRLRPLLGLGASQASREENFAAWRRFLESIAARGPAVVVLEDLHWAGEAMLAFVEHLLSRPLGAPVLIVATARPQIFHEHTGALTAGNGDRLMCLTLPPLSDGEVASLIADLIETRRSKGLDERILGLVGGNPLYAEQYVRLLLDRGFLAPATDVPGLEDGEDLPLPDTIHAVLAARLDTLAPEHKALACDAAVIGESFWCGGVAALSGRSEEEVGGVMAQLVARGFLRPVATSSMDGQTEFRFWHALARDVAYGQLPRKLRARKHEAAARWIERTGGGRADEFAEISAYHYAAALDLARAIGDEELAGSLLRPTIHMLGRAADRALRLDIVASERLFARALELAGKDADQRMALLPGWAEALFLRKRCKEAAAAYEEAIAGHKARGDVRSTARAMCWLANVHADLGEPSRELMEAAVDLLSDDGDSAERAEVLEHYSILLKVEDDDPNRVLDVATQAIEMCERLALPEPTLAMSCRAISRVDRGDLDGLADYELALAAAKGQGLGMERATIEFNFGSLAAGVTGPRAAREILTECLAFSRGCELETYVLACSGALTETARDLGDWDLALAEASRLVASVEDNKGVWDLLVMRSVQALVMAARGEPDEALEFLPWLEETGRQSEVTWTKAFALLAAAAARLCLGESQAVLSLIAEWLATPHAVLSYFDLVPEAIRTAMAAGDGEFACRVAQEFEASLPPATLPLHEHVRSAVRALAAEARGECEAAAAGFADAAGRWRQFGMPYEEAHALLGQGRCLVALGRAPEAAAPLAAAREIFARLGARPALEETDDVLQRASRAQRIS